MLSVTVLLLEPPNKKIPLELFDMVLLVGFMKILSATFLKKFTGIIVNVHPSLLPAFSGKTSSVVHHAVIESGMPESGCTLHLVDEGALGYPIADWEV